MEWSLSKSKKGGLQKALDEFMAKKSRNLNDAKVSWQTIQLYSCLRIYERLTKFAGVDDTRKLIGHSCKRFSKLGRNPALFHGKCLENAVNFI